MKNLTIEHLSEQLNGNLWIKGDLKRIYLDKGHNTKKMSTKTYVYQKENGDFAVSCYIDCPSQAYNWIKSQQEEVVNSVEKQIEDIIRISSLELVTFSEDEDGIKVLISENEQEAKWFTEDEFYNEFSDYPENIFSSIPKKEYDKLVYEPKQPKDTSKIIISSNNKSLSDVENYGVGTKVLHEKFGTGIVVSEDKIKVDIQFENEEFGLKPLLKKFANLYAA